MTKLNRNWACGCLLVLGGCIAQTPPPAPTSRLRVVHASPDAPAVDVCANAAEVIEDLAFNEATDYLTVPAATYNVRVIPTGAGCNSAGVIGASLSLPADQDTTVMAVGLLEDIEPLVLVDDNSAPDAGNAKVRFVHASPDAPTVDITLPDGTTLFDDVSFRENGGYIEVPAGEYTLEVRDDAGETVVLTLEGVAVEVGGVYTVSAVGLAGGEPALDALITQDNG